MPGSTPLEADRAAPAYGDQPLGSKGVAWPWPRAGPAVLKQPRSGARPRFHVASKAVWRETQSPRAIVAHDRVCLGLARLILHVSDPEPSQYPGMVGGEQDPVEAGLCQTNHWTLQMAIDPLPT